jgi:hypothetical protein
VGLLYWSLVLVLFLLLCCFFFVLELVAP